MALLNFKKGLYAGLNNVPKTEGTVYITTDEKAMYVDIDNSTRIRIGQIVELTQAKWEETTPPYDSNVFYYITDKNALIKWNETAQNWIQINSTESLTSRISNLETIINGTSTNTASGLVSKVSALETKMSTAETNITNLQNTRLTDVKVNGTSVVSGTVANITVGALAAKDKVAVADLASDTVKRFTDIESAIEGHSTTISTLATKAELKSATDRITTNEGDITAINNTIGTGFSSTNTIAANVTELKGTLTGFTSTNTVKKTTDDLAAKITSNDNDIAALQAVDSGYATRLTNLESADRTITGNIATINNTLNTHDERITAAKNQADKGVGDAATAQSKADQAFSKAETNATAISGLNTNFTEFQTTVADTYATKTALQNAESALDGKITANTNTLTQHGTTLTDHGSRLTTVEGKAASNATAISKLEGDVSDLKTATTNLSNDKLNISDYNADKAIITGNIEAAQTRADNAYTYADNNKKTIDTHETKISDIQNTLNKVTNIMDFIGVSTTNPMGTSGDGKGVITIDNEVVTTLHVGDVVIYGNKEFVYDGSKWSEFGDATGNASAITELTARVSTNETNITDLQGRMTTAENDIKSHATAIADRYTKSETNAKIADALTWGTWGTT